MGLTARQKLFAARAAIREHLPYWTSLVNGLNYHWVEKGSLDTMGITDTGVVLLDEQDIGRMTVEQTAVSLLHEAAGHWLRDHRTRKPPAADARQWNLAGDCEANDDLRAMVKHMQSKSGGGNGKQRWEVPENMVYPETFKLPENMTAEWYYQEIRKQEQKQAPSKPTCGHGHCGSGAGHALPGEPTKGKEKGEGGGGEGTDQGIPPGLNAGDRGRIAKQVAQAMVKHQQQHGRGSVPGGWSVWADDMIQTPKVDWRRELEAVIRYAVTYRPGAVVTTWRKFGRKQAALGFGPGRPLTPAWRSPVPRIAVCIDTSGSMGKAELSLAVSETDGVLKTLNGEVEFVALDSEIHGTSPVRDIHEVANLLKGGGGTDFRPAFSYFAKQRQRPDVVLFITDGDGPAPSECPPGMTVVWLIVGSYGRRPSDGDNYSNQIDWGKFLFIKSVDGELERWEKAA